VQDCDVCPNIGRWLNDRSATNIALPVESRPDYEWIDHGPNYAPWFNQADPDSTKFLGLVGLEVSGADDGLRTAKVRQAIAGGGVVGKVIQQPRELLIRSVAVAVTEAGMQIGLDWLRRTTFGLQIHRCGGSNLWFLNACPPCADNSPDEACFIKYARHFLSVEIVRGPIVTDYREMPTGGWMAEIEMVAVSPDKSMYGEPGGAWQFSAPGVPAVVHDPPVTVPTPDPVLAKLGITPVTPALLPVTLPVDWNRIVEDIAALPDGPNRLSYTLVSTENLEDLRVEVRDKATGDVLDGFELPWLLANQQLDLNAVKRTVERADGSTISGYVRDYDGFPALAWRTITGAPGQQLELVVDYTGTHNPASLAITVKAHPVESP
jgi:hypothetical protein